MYYRSKGTRQFVIYLVVVLMALVIGILVGATYPEQVNNFLPSIRQSANSYFDELFGDTVEDAFSPEEAYPAVTVESIPTPAPTEVPVPLQAGSDLLPPRPTPRVCVVKTGYETGTINIRLGPGHNFAVVGTAREGDVLTFTAEEDVDGWAPILTEDGLTGYFYIPSWCE
jgi:uncharacterized protein YgiM (DUF1202 family)